MYSSRVLFLCYSVLAIYILISSTFLRGLFSKYFQCTLLVSFSCVTVFWLSTYSSRVLFSKHFPPSTFNVLFSCPFLVLQCFGYLHTHLEYFSPRTFLQVLSMYSSRVLFLCYSVLAIYILISSTFLRGLFSKYFQCTLLVSFSCVTVFWLFTYSSRVLFSEDFSPSTFNVLFSCPFLVLQCFGYLHTHLEYFS